MISEFKALLADESGATALEYGLIAGLVSIAVIAALTAIGISLAGFMGYASGHLDSAAENTRLN